MLTIGLTGGIGSGKTTVANIFAKLGVPIIDADVIAHQITTPNDNAYNDIIQHFGKTILNPDSTIDRKKLRHIIFENRIEKKWLENLLHPIILSAMKNEIKKVKTPYCICVIPLLAESSGIDFVDRVLVVDSPLEKQLLRAKQRDDTTNEMIQKIIDSQANQATRLKIADDVLINDGDLIELEKKISALHRYYLTLE